MQVIIFKNDDGGVSVVHPSPDALASRGINAIAVKDVPAGKPFRIIEASDLPNVSQEAWVVDDADLTDGIGSESSDFPEVPL